VLDAALAELGGRKRPSMTCAGGYPQLENLRRHARDKMRKIKLGIGAIVAEVDRLVPGWISIIE
jgi:hypothetical protein